MIYKGLVPENRNRWRMWNYVVDINILQFMFYVHNAFHFQNAVDKIVPKMMMVKSTCLRLVLRWLTTLTFSHCLRTCCFKKKERKIQSPELHWVCVENPNGQKCYLYNQRSPQPPIIVEYSSWCYNMQFDSLGPFSVSD